MPLPLPARHRRVPAARRRPAAGARRATAWVLATAGMLLTFPVLLASPAAADTSGLAAAAGVGTDLSFGTGTGNGLLDQLTSADAWELGSSTLSLAGVNPLTGMAGGDVADPTSMAYATQADVNNSSLLALDTASLAQSTADAAARARAAQQAQGGGLRPGTVPAPYDAMITDAVAQYCPQLPAPVLAAQLEQESGFRPGAVSGAGAQGIAQFTPATWTTHGVDGNGDGHKDPFDPADAIPAAAAYDCSLLADVKDVPGDQISLMLAAYNAGPGAVQRAHGIPAIPETQGYVSAITSRVAYFTADAPGGCPSTAPSGTLRAGADQVGVAALCSAAVSGAATPQAAGAIRYALSHLGYPYSQPQRNDVGFYDCSSFVSRAYQAAGVPIAPAGQNAPTTVTIAGARWAHRIPFSQAAPGDLIEPNPGHVQMYLGNGWVAETSRTGDVSHVSRVASSTPFGVFRIDPSAA